METILQVYRVQLVREPATQYPASARNAGATDVAKAFRTLWPGLDREQFCTFFLDTKGALIGAHIVSIGTLDSSLIHPREVFKAAIVAGAASIIIVHNHPSGNTQPSEEDILITCRLRDAGRIIGIPVVDHVIVGEEHHFSFSEKGLLQ